TQILGTINSKAIVAPRPANSAGGVTITETAGKNFTAALGTFNAIAPATGLHAIISWGDGTSSVGALKAIGIVGVDVIKFSVSGTAGALGAVSVSGKVKLPGFVASGHATGTLTLSNSQGSVTLALTGPLEPGFGAFPATLSYTVTSATGAYFDNIASGIIAVT